MYMSNSEIKKWAAQKSEGNKLQIIIAVIIVGVISSIVTSILTSILPSNIQTVESMGQTIQVNSNQSIYQSIASLILAPLTIGLIVFVSKIATDTKAEYGMIFDKVKNIGNCGRIILTDLIKTIFIVIFTLLLIVPGIIKALSYGLVDYLLANSDFDDKSSMDVLNISSDLMNGHKMDLFMLELYYCVLMILSAFLLFIPLIWLVPRYHLAKYKFAETLINGYKSGNNSAAA